MTDKSNVIWRGDYRCTACGHRELAAVIGAPGVRYETMDAVYVERVARLNLGLVSCPSCNKQDPAAVARARKNMVAMAGGFLGAAIVGTIAVRFILGPVAAAICGVIAVFVLLFLMVKNRGSSGAASKRVTFAPATS
jgi:hypothetical protein